MIKYLDKILEKDPNFLVDYVKSFYEKSLIAHEIRVIEGHRCGDFDENKDFYSLVVKQENYFVECFYFRDHNFETNSSLEDSKTFSNRVKLLNRCNNKFYMKRIYQKLKSFDTDLAHQYLIDATKARNSYKEIVLEQFDDETGEIIKFMTSD